MALLDMMKHRTSEIDEATMALWDDALPFLSGVRMHELAHTADITLFNHNIRSYLIYSGVPPHLIYPIMRMNGYTHNGDLLHEDEILLVPEVPAMEVILTGLLGRAKSK